MQSYKAEITTDNPKRYIKRLCKHFAHRVDADYSESAGFVDFAPGTCKMEAEESSIVFTINSEEYERAVDLEDVISRHTDQFARDEAFNWHWEEVIPAT
jgi:hypothetical protein